MVKGKGLNPRATWLVVLFLVRSATAAGEPSLTHLAVFHCDATPPLGSKIYDGTFTTVEQPLSAKGIILDDGRERYVLCALDWRWLRGPQNKLLRRKLAEAVSADVSHVAVQCVHQHTAPSGDEADERFFVNLTDRVAAAAKRSLDERLPFDSLGTGQAKVERVASTRRIPTEDGKVRIRFTSTKGRPELRELPEGYIDPYLKTITFAIGNEPLVRMHYYATHPQSFYRDGRVSIDFVGMARERLQEEEGVPHIYFTGCAGDVGAGKYNDGSRRARAELAERMYVAMKASSSATQLAPMERVAWRTLKLSLPWKSPAKEARAGGPIEMSSLQIGRVCILNLPGEPMVAFQRYAQDLALDVFVAVAGYGDINTGYICTKKAFSEGGYEPRGSALAPHAESSIKKAIRELLGME